MIARFLQSWFPKNQLGTNLILSMIRMGLVFFCFVLVGYSLIYVNFQSSYQNLDRISQMQDSLFTLEKALIDQETGQRGYELTGDPQFLEPFATGSADFQSEAVLLANNATGDPKLHALVQQLIAQGYKWHTLYGLPQVQKKQQGGVITTAEMLEGKSTFDNFRILAGQAKGQVTQLEAQEKTQLYTKVLGILVALVVISMVLGVSMLLLTTKRFRVFIEVINRIIAAVSSFAERKFEVKIPKANKENEFGHLLDSLELMRVELRAGFHMNDAILEVVKVLQESLNSRDICEKTNKGIVHLIGTEYGSIAILDEEQQFVLTNHLENDVFENRNATLHPDESEGLQQALIGEPVLFANMEEYRPFGSRETAFYQAGYRSAMYIPVKDKEGRVMTIITLRAKTPGFLTKQHVEIVLRMAPLISLAMKNAILHEQVERLAANDSLTGAWNRRYFDEAIERALRDSRRSKLSFALLMLDVDFFKNFNDTYGHPVGDRLLITIVRVLQQHVRPLDIVARYGGEEFVVILPNTDAEGGRACAERFRQAILQDELCSSYQVTASFGLAVSTEEDEALTLIQRADRALYKAKRNGRNRVEVEIQEKTSVL